MSLQAILTPPGDLVAAHKALERRSEVGLAPEEAETLRALAAGQVVVGTLEQLAEYFGCDRTAFRRWREHDVEGALDGPTYNVRACERVRHRMLHNGQRLRLLRSDLWRTLRRREGF